LLIGCGERDDGLGDGLVVDRMDVVEPPRLLLMLLGHIGGLVDGDLGGDGRWW
jgi:hypothetical protein